MFRELDGSFSNVNEHALPIYLLRKSRFCNQNLKEVCKANRAPKYMAFT